LSIDALTNDRLWPYPYMDSVATVSILVDRSGKRFADEGRGGVFLANMIAKLDDPLSTFLVFDHTTWEGPAKARHVPPNPHLKNAGGTLFSAGTIAELAAQAGIDAGALAATVAQYNEAVGAGRFDGLEPQRTPDRYKPLPIVDAPFYAMPLCAGITNTMGGILTDDRGRVLDTDEKPIAGLFAAGCTTGGLEGGPCAGYVGGLAKTSAMSLRVGETIGQM
jgi:fumarate reductase flavoprotein subunit